jgi:hypothetical protein
MSQDHRVDARIVDALQVTQRIVEPRAAYAQGDGMAYQVVAQATASAVADASSHLRNVSALSLAAMAAMTARMAESGDAAKWQTAINEVQASTREAARIFQMVGETSANVLTAFKNT